jgi:hypothetical protein
VKTHVTMSWAIASLLLVASAASIASEWRAYGTDTLGGVQVYWFYERLGIAQGSAGLTQVWTKAVKATDLLTVARQDDSARVQRVKARQQSGDVPPVARLKNMSKDEVTNYRVMEDIATNGNVDFVIRYLREIDCAGRRIRISSGSAHENDEYNQVHRQADWTDISPDTDFDTLAKLVCPSKRLD